MLEETYKDRHPRQGVARKKEHQRHRDSRSADLQWEESSDEGYDRAPKKARRASMHDGMEGASCMSERRRAVRPKRGRERAESDDSRREDRPNRRPGRRPQDTPSALKERDKGGVLLAGEKTRDSPPSQLRIKTANVPVSRDILEHMVPGVTGCLTPEEIEQLKDISAKLPG